MLWVGKGKVPVQNAGTPVGFNAPYKAFAVMFTYDPADSGTVYIKDRAGNIMTALTKGTTGQPILFASPQGDQIDLRDFQIDVVTPTEGPFVAVATC